jgi:perosamine synthetase
MKVNNMEISLDAPNLGEVEKANLIHCVDSNFVSTMGPFVNEFEEKFAKYVDAPGAVSVQSGTAALHIALLELGIGPGDEVILPVLSFVASVNPILYVGATPRFVDVDPHTWNIDPKEVLKAITPKTKAILPVHLYGNPCDMDALIQISESKGIPLIEDATESLGATWNEKLTGTLSEYGCFSFNGNKVITTGGGGMVVTKTPEAAAHVKFIVNQARDTNRGYYHPELGYNYRMTNMEASMGLAQLQRLDGFLEQKQKFHSIYQEILGNISGLTIQKEYPSGLSNWWLVSITVNRPGFDMVKFQKDLRELGVPTRRVFMPMTEFPYLKQYATGKYPVAHSLYKQGLNLPGSTLNSEEAILKVAQIILNLLK